MYVKFQLWWHGLYIIAFYLRLKKRIFSINITFLSSKYPGYLNTLAPSLL